MPREYKKIKQYEKEISKMHEEGFTYRKIGEKLGYTKTQVKEFAKRQRKRIKEHSTKTVPKRRGRPRKKPITSQREMELEINKLKMENELLRDFLQSFGRR